MSKSSLRIALRNLLSNKIRTALSIMMISGAVIAIVVFQGYALRTLDLIQEVVINGQFGHLQIGKNSYWNQDAKSRLDLLISQPDELEKKIASHPDVDFVSQRLTFFGLISTENNSETGQFIGIDVAKEKYFSKGVEILKGTALDSANQGSILVANLLADRLHLNVGDQITVVASTMDQVMNAVDLKVAGIFTTGTDEFDRLSCFMHLEDVRSILQTNSAEHLRISLKSVDTLDSVKNQLNTQFADQNLQTRSWYELSDVFRKVEIFYTNQTWFMYTILLFIVGLGIVNTFSMSLTERKGEIGTLRALGQSRMSLFGHFMLEIFYMCFIGVSLGGISSFALISTVNAAQIFTDLPGASAPVMIEIGFYPFILGSVAVTVSFVVGAVTSFLISQFVRIEIPELLRHNI